MESVKQLSRSWNCCKSRSSWLDTLSDMLEDKGIYEQLEKLNVKIKEIKNLKPTHEQVRDLLEGLNKLQKLKAY